MSMRQGHGRRGGVRIGAVKPTEDKVAYMIACGPDHAYAKNNDILGDGLTGVSSPNNSTRAKAAFDFAGAAKVQNNAPHRLDASISFSWICFNKIALPAALKSRIVWNVGGGKGYFIKIENSAGPTPRKFDVFLIKSDLGAIQVFGDIASAWDTWDFFAVTYDGVTGILSLYTKEGLIAGSGVTGGVADLAVGTGAPMVLNGDLGSEITDGEVGKTIMTARVMKENEVMGFLNKYRHRYGI